MKSDPGNRLFSTPTANSLLRIKTIPQNHFSDSLDLSLSSIYNHNTQWWASSALTIKQSRIKFSNEPSKEIKINPKKDQHHNMVIYKENYRNDINHVEIGLASNHLSSSNRGFGRSFQGIFFTS